MTERPEIEPRTCDCGCGQEFMPTRSWHRFIDKNHRWTGWRKTNLEARSKAESSDKIMRRLQKLVAIDGRITAAEMAQRLKKIDKYLNGRAMKKTKA
jgi:hypothetical protein